MGEEEISGGGGGGGGTQLLDLPDALLTAIVSLVRDVRSRNSASLACRRFRSLERATRTHLTLRGSWRHLYLLPTCFPTVTHLDLSFLSPWGAPVDHLAALSIPRSFPRLSSLSFYARDALSLTPHFPHLQHLRLVRWHQRPQSLPGHELLQLLRSCPLLSSLDLSSFYHWTEDLPSALNLLRPSKTCLVKLDLLCEASLDGMKSPEILSIASGCPLLQWLRIPCVFDPRYDDAVVDESLLSIAENCRSLRTLIMIERRGISDDGPAMEARVTPLGLETMFGLLKDLQEFEFDCRHLVKESGTALEALKGRKMASLRLGGLQSICIAGGLHLDGVAAIGGLQELAVRNCDDLTDAALAMIGRGCSRLERFELEGCNRVTLFGLKKMVSLLRSTLVDVKISFCSNLNGFNSIKALEPICDRIESLHMDCVWHVEGGEEEEDRGKQAVLMDDDDDCEFGELDRKVEMDERDDVDYPRRKRCRFTYGSEVDFCVVGESFWSTTWGRLKRLNLWVPVGELLTPLAGTSLDICPELEEVNIKVEGDCRTCTKPAMPFGLRSLLHYPMLRKMKLDLSNVIGYVWTAPIGHVDLSSWERFYLRGIEELLGLEEFDYWPPQDRDVNQRSLSLPAVGLLAECAGLRKLFIHGTLHEHFMRFLLNIPNLRDVQLLEDYYPAPENDTSTEMRMDSCIRFEEAINRRSIPD